MHRSPFREKTDVAGLALPSHFTDQFAGLYPDTLTKCQPQLAQSDSVGGVAPFGAGPGAAGGGGAGAAGATGGAGSDGGPGGVDGPPGDAGDDGEPVPTDTGDENDAEAGDGTAPPE